MSDKFPITIPNDSAAIVKDREESVKVEFTKLVEHYSNFFTPKQIDALIYLWYGLDISEVASLTNLSTAVISEWLADRNYQAAVRAGYGRRKEILVDGIERIAPKALKVINDILEDDISPESRAFTEKIKTARWVIERIGVDLSPQEEQNSGQSHSTVTEETAKLIAEELRRSAGASSQQIDVKDVFRDDIVEGEVVNPAMYYRIVDSTDVSVEPGVVNVHKETLKLQCHLCGKWFNSLALHLGRNQGHPGVTVKFYREYFNIPAIAPLDSGESLLDILADKLESKSVEGAEDA